MKRWLLISLLLTAAALAGSLYVYLAHFDTLPAQLPIHWDVSGEPDNFIPKENALWALLIGPGVMALFVVLGLVLPWLSPKPFDIERFRPTYEHVIVLLVELMGYIHAALLLGYLRQDLNVVRLLVSGIFVFFALVGNVLGKLRRNFWIGVRTPWTLASETVWVRTHRFTAWLWTPVGAIGALAVVLGAPLEWCFVAVLVAALVPVVYSLVVYKRLEKEGKLPDAA